MAGWVACRMAGDSQVDHGGKTKTQPRWGGELPPGLWGKIDTMGEKKTPPSKGGKKKHHWGKNKHHFPLAYIKLEYATVITKSARVIGNRSMKYARVITKSG